MDNRIYAVFEPYPSPHTLSMDTITQNFTQALRKLRSDKKLTQEELAQRSGIDYKYLQKLEGQNPSSPTLSTLCKLAKGLGITLAELISSIPAEP
ncbi:MAG: helix-turn-helix transcriptional regulator [Desulfovibrionaceae bacterium]|nr:helix-turn-helix transcriptional regulator [Desulfovibrionaceae bacterium]